MHNEAFGRPGLAPNWASGSKQGVGTSASARSRVWFTIARGIITEVYYPRVDIANTRDLQFLVTDGRSFFHEEQRDLSHSIEYVDPKSLAYRIVTEDPAGRYRIVKHVVTDPESDTLLVRVRFQPLDPTFDRCRLYVLLAPHVKNQGLENRGEARSIAGKTALTAWREDVALALVSSAGFKRVSCGFSGFSDGWQDLHQDFKMDWQFATASGGNIALTGEIDLTTGTEFTLALGFGPDPGEAARTALGSLARPYAAVEARYIDEWREYCERLVDLRDQASDGGLFYYTSVMALKAHEDKTYPGAFVASLSVPWGEKPGDAGTGGYHLCWPRDLVHVASGCLAAGDRDAAVRALRYLQRTQNPDGGWAQNCWVDGRPYWNSLQLDEVALPVLLAYRLCKAGAINSADDDTYRMVRKAARCLALCGPVTLQDRWEENSGYSPATLAVGIAALVCAAEIVRSRGEHLWARYLLDVADYWESGIEGWTFTRCGELLPGFPEYYERIAGRRPDEVDRGGTECRLVLPLANQEGGGPQTSQCCIVDGGFLELVRYGIRRPNDPHVLKTLKVYDAMLRVDTPSGPSWRRYNLDGYGEHDDGAPYDGTGRGRAWPLLTGERGHYELAAGHDTAPYVEAMERMANGGRMLPEQIWDADDLPERGLFKGRGTGSATPLAWAHAEYVALLRSTREGRPFDRVDRVERKYARRTRPAVPEIWKFNHKLRAVRSSDHLRIEVGAPATLRWTRDSWETFHDDPLTEIAPDTRIYAKEFQAGTFAPGRALEFTFCWPPHERWEGVNFTVAVV